MSRELHDIPPAPRQAHWSAALWYRWPFALAAFVLLVYGGLWTLMLFFASSGKPLDDERLNQFAQRTVGTVTDVKPTEVELDGVAFEHVNYEFSTGPVTVYGASFAPALVAGTARIEIEFLPEAPSINRVRGGRISLLGNWVRPAFWFTVVPGAVCLLLWLFGVLRIRRTLIEGDAAIAQIDSIRPVRWLVPSMLSVQFSFRDHNANEQRGSHWVRERSRAGQRLLRRPEFAAVIHCRERPNRHRLVSVDQFS